MTRASNPLVRDAWQARIDAQPLSGLSIAEFCSQQACSVAAFHYWKRKLAQGTATGSAVANRPASQSNPFLQVAMPRTVPTTTAWTELSLPGGIIARNPADQRAALELVLRYSDSHTRH